MLRLYPPMLISDEQERTYGFGFKMPERRLRYFSGFLVPSAMSASSSNLEPAGDAGGSLHLRVAAPFTGDGFGAIHMSLDLRGLEGLCGVACSLSRGLFLESIFLPAFFFPDTKQPSLTKKSDEG